MRLPLLFAGLVGDKLELDIVHVIGLLALAIRRGDKIRHRIQPLTR